MKKYNKFILESKYSEVNLPIDLTYNDELKDKYPWLVVDNDHDLLRFKQYVNESHTKFKVGDKIVYNGKFYKDSSMVKNYINKIATIIDISDFGNQRNLLQFENGMQWYAGDFELEPLPDDIDQYEDWDDINEGVKDIKGKEINVGDIVVCRIPNRNFLNKDKEYKVVGIDNGYLELENENGMFDDGWGGYRFELLYNIKSESDETDQYEDWD